MQKIILLFFVIPLYSSQVPVLRIQCKDGSKTYSINSSLCTTSKTIADNLENEGDYLSLDQVGKQTIELLSIWSTLSSQGKSDEVKKRLKTATPKGLQCLLGASHFLDIAPLTPLITAEYFHRLKNKKSIQHFFNNPQNFKEQYLSFAENDSVQVLKPEMVQLSRLVSLFPYLSFSKKQNPYLLTQDFYFPTFGEEDALFLTIDGGVINCFNVVSGVNEKQITGHNDRFLTTDKKKLVVTRSNGSEKKVTIYDTKTLQEKSHFDILASEEICDIFNDGNSLVLTDKNKRMIKIHDRNNKFKQREMIDKIKRVSLGVKNTLFIILENKNKSYFITTLDVYSLKTKTHPVDLRIKSIFSNRMAISADECFFSIDSALYTSSGELIDVDKKGHFDPKKKISQNNAFFLTRRVSGCRLLNIKNKTTYEFEKGINLQWIGNDFLIGQEDSLGRLIFIDAQQGKLISTPFYFERAAVSESGKTVALDEKDEIVFYDLSPFIKKDLIPAELLFGLIMASNLENITDQNQLDKIKLYLITHLESVHDIELKRSLNKCIMNTLHNIPLPAEKQTPELSRSHIDKNPESYSGGWDFGYDDFVGFDWR